MKTLIIGHGEIGNALGKVLSDYRPYFIDNDPSKGSTAFQGQEFDIMHVAIPYSDDFVGIVKQYQNTFKPKFTVIHSTVPIGISRQLNAVFSPVVGLHPHLETSLKTFTKFLGGEQASQVANYFRRAGMKVYLFDKSEPLELAKLSQTTFYALMVEYIKNLKQVCDANNVSFTEVYTLPSQDYNRGYEQLGYSEFKMPLLTPIMTVQGGHCTRRNCDLWNTAFTDFIKQLNDSYETKTATEMS